MTVTPGRRDVGEGAGPPGRGTLLRTGRFVTHLDTVRPDLVFYSGLVSVAGALLAADDPSPWRLLGAWAAPTLGWFAAMYGGDYFDRDLDAIAKPQRPIPSGRMPARVALAGMVACIGLGMVIALALNPISGFVVIVTAALGIAYSKYLKARGIWGNVVRGAITAMAFLFGVLAVAPSPPLELLPIALIFWLHDSASNVIGAICDADGDRAGGYHTFPVRHGEAAALRLLVGLHLAWFVLALGYPVVLADRYDLGLGAYAAFLAVATVMCLVSTVMMLRAPRPIPRVSGLRAHEVLVVERLVLACAVIAAVSGALVGLVVVVPAVLGTVLASVLMMRHRYEPSRARSARRMAPEKAS